MLLSADSLLSGLRAYQITKLQVLQDTAASIMSFTRQFDHITPVLKESSLAACQLSDYFQDFTISHQSS